MSEHTLTADERAHLSTSTAATDCLEDHGFHAEAETLRGAPGKSELLERAVAILEDRIRVNLAPDSRVSYLERWGYAPMIAVIAEHRGETPEVTLARLGPTRVARGLQPGTACSGHHEDIPRRIDRSTHMAGGARDADMMDRIRSIVPDAVEVSHSPSDPLGTVRVRRRDGSTVSVDVEDVMEGRPR